MANPIKITPDRLEYLHGLSKETLTTMIGEGRLPEFLGDPMSLDEALAELDRLWETHKVALTGAGVDYVFGLLHTLATPDFDLGNFEELVSTLSDEELVQFAEGEADAAEAQKAALIDARADLLADLHGVASKLVKAAFATALGAALGLPPVPVL